MDWPKRIIIVRHGESEGNAISADDLSFYNKANHAFALTEQGKKQAEEIGKYLRTRYGVFDAYFCSTFRRTQETLSLMYPEAKQKIDSRLNELWRGIWHTMPEKKVIDLYSEEVIVKEREGEFHYRPPGGQNCQDVEIMIHSFIFSLKADYSNHNILVSAHGNWMLLFWRIVLDRKPAEFEYRYKNNKYKNFAISVYEQSSESMDLVA